MKFNRLVCAFGVLALIASASAADVKTVSKGQRVEIKDILAPGKRTIVEFYADWCGPCREAEPKLQALAARDTNIALRKIDIKDWRSPVATQFGIRSIPHVKVYDASGKLEDEGSWDVIQALSGGGSIPSGSGGGGSYFTYFSYTVLALGAGLYLWGKARPRTA